MRRTLGAGAAAAIAVWAAAAHTAPKPSEVPTSWELQIRYEKPTAISVKVPGKDRPQRFWFLRYMVINQTGEDRIFVPTFILYTDTGQILHAGRDVPKVVFNRIKGLYDDPLLKDMTAMTGKLLQGEDNAKRGVAIWPEFDPRAGGFDIFVGGLSGETVEIDLHRPIQVSEYDTKGNKVTVTRTKAVLSKTLQLAYRIPGDAPGRPRAGIRRVKRTWVMR
jgi:hypothetical protein